MGRASKRAKQVEEEDISSSEETSGASEGGTGFDSNLSEDSDSDRFDEEDAGAPDGNSDDDDDDMDDEGEEEGSGDEEIDGQNDAEMEELEKEYHSLRNNEQDLLKNLKRHKDEDAIKGQAVKNQKYLKTHS